MSKLTDTTKNKKICQFLPIELIEKIKELSIRECRNGLANEIRYILTKYVNENY